MSEYFQPYVYVVREMRGNDKFKDVDIKQFKKDDIEFDYISKHDFNKFKDRDYMITGNMYVNDECDQRDRVVVVTRDPDKTKSYHFKHDKPHKMTFQDKLEISISKGYVQVNEKTFVRLIDKRLGDMLIPCLIAVLLLSFIILICTQNQEAAKDNITLSIAESTEWSKELPDNNVNEEIIEYTDIPGYGDLTVSEEDPYVNLINLPGNTVLMSYTIVNDETEEVIYETEGVIEAGKMVPVDFYNLLGESGVYDLTFVIHTYDDTTQAACNTVDQNVQVTVK
jgi:hypothetical protein